MNSEEPADIAARAAATAAANATIGIMDKLGSIERNVAVGNERSKNMSILLDEVRNDQKQIRSLYVTQVEMRLLEESLKKEDDAQQKQIDGLTSAVAKLTWALAIATGGLLTIQILNSLGLLKIN